jgi:hypothetical protein
MIVLTACQKAEVKEYNLPKVVTERPNKFEQQSQQQAAVAHTQPAPANAAILDTRPLWNIPATWIAQAPNPMRQAAWDIIEPDGNKCEVTVTAFPGVVGGTLANVNRWCEQIKLPPLDAVSLEKVCSPMFFSGLKGNYIQLINPHPEASSILVATVTYADVSWFFKLTGPTTLVLKQQADFESFLKSVRFP